MYFDSFLAKSFHLFCYGMQALSIHFAIFSFYASWLRYVWKEGLPCTRAMGYTLDGDWYCSFPTESDDRYTAVSLCLPFGLPSAPIFHFVSPSRLSFSIKNSVAFSRSTLAPITAPSSFWIVENPTLLATCSKCACLTALIVRGDTSET